jgi:hypothetical protein
MAIAGDLRLSRRCDMIVEAIAAKRSLVVREIGGRRAGEIAVHRFLGSPRVTPEELIEGFAERTAHACVGRTVVAVQDTTEINFLGRAAARRGLGPAGDGISPGFFIHPVIAVDADSEAVLGPVGVEIWTRGAAKVSDRKSRALAEKESRRWLTGAQTAAGVLKPAASITVIGDQESDIYELFASKPEEVELLVRARHARRLVDGGGLADRPFAPTVGTRAAVAAKPPAETARTACFEVAFGPVCVRKPDNAAANTPKCLTLHLVETREVDGPLAWQLLTSRPIETAEAALEAVRLYRLRWRIEEVFRLMKRDGLALEDSQIETAPRLFNLAALALQAAVRILQLVDARDGSQRPATDVVDRIMLAPAAVIGQTLEGKTARQKNPHPPDSLAWLAWIVARLGGWNCYYKPPGPKTMARGWKRFEAMIHGYFIATGKSLV